MIVEVGWSGTKQNEDKRKEEDVALKKPKQDAEINGLLSSDTFKINMEERRPKAMRTKEQRPRTSWEEMTMTKLTRNAGRHHAILGYYGRGKEEWREN